eukprot:403372808
MLVFIVQNLQEHRDILDKLSYQGGFMPGDGLENFNEFYGNDENLIPGLEENGITAIQPNIDSERDPVTGGSGSNDRERLDTFQSANPSRQVVPSLKIKLSDGSLENAFQQEDPYNEVNSSGQKILQELASQRDRDEGHQNIRVERVFQQNQDQNQIQNGLQNIMNNSRVRQNNPLSPFFKPHQAVNNSRLQNSRFNFNQQANPNQQPPSQRTYLNEQDQTLNLNTPLIKNFNPMENQSIQGSDNDMKRKMEFMENRIAQHESLIQFIRNQLKPDQVKEKQIENEKKEIKEKINGLSIRVNAIEQCTEFLRQDQEQLSNVLTSPQKQQDQNDLQNDIRLTPSKSVGSEEQQSTIQMLQGLMMRTRKDIQDKFEAQIKNLEQRVMSQLESLQNWIMSSNQMGDDGMDGDEQYAQQVIPNTNRGDINAESLSLNNSLIKGDPNQSFDVRQNADKLLSNTNVQVTLNQSTINQTKNTTQGTIPGIILPKAPMQMMQQQQFRYKLPQKQLNDIKDVQKKIENFESSIKELYERHQINDRIVGKINEYYESNLRVISVRGLGEQIKDFEKQLEGKANNLEVKKLISSIHECNDKFNWLEERYKEERKDQESINQNFQLALKNVTTRASLQNDKINNADHEIQNMLLSLKKIDQNSWMNGLGGGGAESRFQSSEQIDELQKDIQMKFTDFSNKLKSFQEEFTVTVTSVKEQLKQKISHQNLADAEERMQALIDKVIQNINKRFMDRQDVKKALKQFESQIESIIELLYNKVDEFEVNDAMLAKKPLGGWSCISCQKNIQNVSGNPGDYLVNNKMPQRDMPLDHSHKLPRGLSKLIQNYGINNPSGNKSQQVSTQIQINSNHTEAENLRYKPRQKGGAAANLLLQSIGNSVSPDRSGNQQQQHPLTIPQPQTISEIASHRGSSTKYLIQPKMKSQFKSPSLGQSQSQKRFLGDSSSQSELLKDLQMEGFNNRQYMQQKQESIQVTTLNSPSSLPMLNNNKML